MIKLEKNGIYMEVSTDVQASAFLNNGWAATIGSKEAMPDGSPQNSVSNEEKPQAKRGRKPAATK